MANIVINGATYKDVPSIEVPSSDGGVAEFEETDITDTIMTRTITNYSNSRISSLGNYALCQCKSLSSVDLKSVTTIGEYGLCNCYSLSSVDLKSVTTIGEYGLCNCYSLSSVDLKSVTTIGRYGLYGCESLSALIMRGSTICALSHSDAFSASGISLNKGFIYVPSDLVESYKTATNWSVYASQFRALEDYTVDGTITGELDESKI